MRLLRCFAFAAFVALAASIVPAAADEPPHPTFAPIPPGTIVANQLVYLAGEAMHSQWRGVLSKRLVGKNGTTSFYQWYLSIYQIDGTTYKLRYQSPANGGPFDKVAKASGAPMWFPYQEGSIVGTGELTEPGVQQLVVATHQTGADCGSALVTIFGYDGKTNKVVTLADVENACSLSAKIIPGALQLNGPYYSATAALCCPTKPKASAVLKYVNGAWVQTPDYYRVKPRTRQR